MRWLPRARVAERVRGARLGGAQRHRAAVHGVAGAVVHGLPLVELGARAGVGDDVQLVGRAVVLEPADDRLVGEDGLAVRDPDDLARGALRLGGLGALRLGGGHGLPLRRRRGEGRAGVHVPQLGAGRLGDALRGARLGLGDHEVAAEDRQSRVGPLVTGVGGAVAVLDDVADDQLLLRAEAEFLGLLRLARVGGPDEGGALGGERSAGRAPGSAWPADWLLGATPQESSAVALPVWTPTASMAAAATRAPVAVARRAGVDLTRTPFARGCRWVWRLRVGQEERRSSARTPARS